MKKMKKILAILLSFIMINVIVVTPKAAVNEDMKAVWITTVYNQDWPSVGARNNVAQQKQEFINILEDIKSLGLNTVIVQVRPKGDALYKSNINPWSEVLTGTQGKDPGYDPLTFITEEAHKRGIKVHAWLNPYRVTTSGTDANVLSENHFARQNPQTLITDGKALYYNPGLPEVRQHIIDTVDEIVRNYNVDGIHFDDYFYPGNNVNDSDAYSKYGNGMDIGDFRRSSVNELVKAIYNKVKSINSNVEFGISPRGIWKNNSSDPTGSDTRGAQSYYDIYGDTRTWIKNEWLDYVAPQVYWEIGNSAADYSKLIPWWSNEVNGTNVKLYIGHAVYKPTVAKEIDKQIELNRQYPNVRGSIFFSYRDVKNNVEGVREKIVNSLTVPVVTLAGSDRYGTAVKLSQSQFNKADTIVIVNGLAISDGLSATPLATYLNSPILLTRSNLIPDVTKDEIRRLNSKKAIIIGGNTVVDSNVESSLRSLGISTIERLGGSDRYATSLQIAKYIDSNLYDVENIVVSNGLGEADAMSIAAVAGRDRMPIILSRVDKLNDDIYSWLRGEGLNNAYIIGGQTVLSNNILNSINGITSSDISGNRLGGANRYDTNAMVIERFYGSNLNKVYASKGLVLVDALTSGPIAALNNGPVVLCNTDLTSAQKNILSLKNANSIVEAGGGISKIAVNSLKSALK
ncbi:MULTISPECIES: family 10 glycosylhydrolase [Clostridium]|uniref:family 10 glycosylhydrolase n=2 Tax=Clostridium TaxID=1485 RepID=UPI0022E57364|nr:MULTISPECIES: family 10 glycosylhydrolase [Clostridium]MDU1567707.1 family 10 glycosylhydrolase [Clostridium sp.]MDU7949455.1 family 10 glycosylhydrolase [Clostridium sp.]